VVSPASNRRRNEPVRKETPSAARTRTLGPGLKTMLLLRRARSLFDYAQAAMDVAGWENPGEVLFIEVSRDLGYHSA